MVFASSVHDLGVLGRELALHGIGRVVGASTGRVIGANGFEPDAIVGFRLPAGRFAVADTLLEDVADMGLPELRARVRQLQLELGKDLSGSFEHRFALLLVDAESRCEERLAAVLGMELNGLPLIGGSAGDLYFNPLGHPPGSTRLLYHGSAKRGAAILCLVASASPVIAYCHNHFMQSDKKFVITDADPARRLVREIDGRPALEVYAAACGFRRPPRQSGDFAPFPLMIRIGGGHYYARGVQRSLPGRRTGVRVRAGTGTGGRARQASRHDRQPRWFVYGHARPNWHAGTRDRRRLRGADRLYWNARG